jgi:hypothetical protein
VFTLWPNCAVVCRAKIFCSAAVETRTGGATFPPTHP